MALGLLGVWQSWSSLMTSSLWVSEWQQAYRDTVRTQGSWWLQASGIAGRNWKGRWSTEGMGQTLWLLSLLESPVVREFRHEDFIWLSQVTVGLQGCSQRYIPGNKVQKGQSGTCCCWVCWVHFTSLYSFFSPVQLIPYSPFKYITSSIITIVT